MSMVPRQPSEFAIKAGQHPLDHTGSMHYQPPMNMWNPVPSQSPNVAAMSMMPQNQQHSTLSLLLQTQGLRYYPGPVKMFPTAMQQTQNSQFYHASVACSKRFSEDEKQKLEKVFTDETQKPSTSRKRQLAEELGCPVPKVNVGQPVTLRFGHLLTGDSRTGSRTAELGRNRSTESRLTRQAKLQSELLPRMMALTLKRMRTMRML